MRVYGPRISLRSSVLRLLRAVKDGGTAQVRLCPPFISISSFAPLEHDSEKWTPVFRKNHTQSKT